MDASVRYGCVCFSGIASQSNKYRGVVSYACERISHYVQRSIPYNAANTAGARGQLTKREAVGHDAPRVV